MKPRKILVIEDDRDIARLVELHLHDLGYEVQLAHDGVSGLKHVCKRFNITPTNLYVRLHRARERVRLAVETAL
ncbi:MAG: hypothetical protein E8D47_04880 [Nitrospira sp.]|nr:MAG: hypothetical protein E8D47_04880 [Nitrospira sp.]